MCRPREECDELRPILARQHQNEVFAERAKQIEIAGIIKEREKEGTEHVSVFLRFTMCEMINFQVPILDRCKSIEFK